MMKQTTVLATGSFDPLHRGHVFYLDEAKKLGDKLVVVVSSDEKIIANKKHQPRVPEEERIKTIIKTNLADEVMLGEKLGEYKIIDKIKPDIIALGYDQEIPKPLKNKVKKYKIITLKPYRPDIYKSSLISR